MNTYLIDLPDNPNATFSTTIEKIEFNIEFRVLGGVSFLYVKKGQDYLVNGVALSLNIPLNLATQYLQKGFFMILGNKEPIFENFSELEFVYVSL